MIMDAKSVNQLEKEAQNGMKSLSTDVTFKEQEGEEDLPFASRWKRKKSHTLFFAHNQLRSADLVKVDTLCFVFLPSPQPQKNSHFK